MKVCYFADLTHTAQGVHAPYFPLGAGLVAAYAKQQFVNEIEVEVFKFPDDLESAIIKRKPDFLCMSFYSWNVELSYSFAKIIKKRHPEVITVCGGPNFPLDTNAQKDFFKTYSSIDFFINGEGELAFVDLFHKLKNCSFDIQLFKSNNYLVNNCIYADIQGKITQGQFVRTIDLNQLPCPYTTGLLDKFFDLPLTPLYQTTRGCPFSCTYCTGGKSINGKIYRYSFDRIKESLTYITNHIKKSDILVLADLNFGMYDQDLQVCEFMAKLTSEFNYPLTILSSYGKNNLKNVKKAAEILKETWFIGASLQSSDAEVLRNIKRKNISITDMIDLAKFGQSQGTPSISEIILALPGDTVEKHIQSIKTIIHAGMKNIRIYQLILLPGTEISSIESRIKYQMDAKFRIMNRCAGIYKLFNEEIRISEFQEFVYGNSTMSLEDYCKCRFIDLIVEIFYNNFWFEEVFELFSLFSIPIFDCFLTINNNMDVLIPKTITTYDNFKNDILINLFDTYEQIQNFAQQPGVIENYISGELGKNELLDNKTLAYLHLKDTFDTFYNVAASYLRDRNLLSSKTELYLNELKRFCYYLKSDFRNYEEKIIENFLFDFDFIARQNFRVDPNSLHIKDRKYKFYHSDATRSMIKKSLDIYGTSVPGLGRLIQRTNMKYLYRTFICVT